MPMPDGTLTVDDIYDIWDRATRKGRPVMWVMSWQQYADITTFRDANPKHFRPPSAWPPLLLGRPIRVDPFHHGNPKVKVEKRKKGKWL